MNVDSPNPEANPEGRDGVQEDLGQQQEYSSDTAARIREFLDPSSQPSAAAKDWRLTTEDRQRGRDGLQTARDIIAKAKQSKPEPKEES